MSWYVSGGVSCQAYLRSSFFLGLAALQTNGAEVVVEVTVAVNISFSYLYF